MFETVSAMLPRSIESLHCVWNPRRGVMAVTWRDAAGSSGREAVSGRRSRNRRLWLVEVW